MISETAGRFMSLFSCLIMVFAVLVNAQTPTYNAREYMTPFWSTDTMFNESVLMVAADSSSPAESPLLFTPTTILSVRNAALTVEYKENVDWVYTNGKLKLLPGSSARFLTNSQLYPDSAGTPIPDVAGPTKPKLGGGFILYREGYYLHNRQLAVTYIHQKNVWHGPVPQYANVNLPKTTRKLVLGEPLKIVFYGNSITVGYNSSGKSNVRPYMPGYAYLVVEKLQHTFTSAITFKNSASGGKKSDWGLANVNSLVSSENPDLVVISFGMNDGTARVSSNVFKQNNQAIMDSVRKVNPTAEFILVATSLPNPEWELAAGFQASYLPVLESMVGEGVAVANVTGAHQELLKYKHFWDVSGSNINHPNDFLHRWYAQIICGLLIPPPSVVTAFPRNQIPDFQLFSAQENLSRKIFTLNGRMISDPRLVLNNNRSGDVRRFLHDNSSPCASGVHILLRGYNENAVKVRVY